MADGTFTTQNKIRPGAYVNMQSVPTAVGRVAERGICALPMTLDFGPVKEITAVTAQTDFHRQFGHRLTETEMLPVREALKRAKTCLVYRLNGGKKAAATGNGLTITACWPGSAGNQVTVQVSAIADDSGRFNVNTYYAGELVDNQVVSNLSQLTGNDFVLFSGSGTPTATAGLSLTGGTEDGAKVGDYTDFCQVLSLEEFQTAAFPTSDAAVISAACAFVKRMREDEGKKCQIVVATDTSPDYEGVINVKNGVVLADGTAIDRYLATCYAAGATAGASIAQSLTYDTYDDAVTVSPRYTGQEIEKLLTQGYFLFTEKNGTVVCEQDINSLVSTTGVKSGRFQKNRVIRVLDNLGNDIRRIFEEHYIGKIANNATGRALFKAECIQYLRRLAEAGAVTNFAEDTDIQVLAGESGDSVAVQLQIQPVDSLEKLYMTVIVS
jgi:hypothetical protein